MNEPKLILGIDPGLNITGYGIVDISGPTPQLVEAGVLRSKRRDDLSLRLKSIHDGLVDVLSSFDCHAIAIEELYSHYDRPTTAIMMGHARGVLYLAAGQNGLPIHPYAATQVKKMLTGNGRAGKQQVQQAITHHLNLSVVPDPPDVADALAIALCHFYLSQRPASLT
jgi:crossover junction endodeoxyribonuclease RuvC